MDYHFFRRIPFRFGRTAFHYGWAFALTLLASSAWSLDPTLALSQYSHTSWTSRSGFSQYPVNAIAQTADGYLWLGTDKGLVRFDGIRFVPWKTGSSPDVQGLVVRALAASSSRSGQLWIGTPAGVSLLNGNRLTTITPVQGLPAGALVQMHEDRRGRLWVITSAGRGGVSVIENMKARTYGQKHGLPGDGILTIHEDTNGTIWLGTRNGICEMVSSDQFACGQAPGTDVIAIATDSDGTLLIVDAKRRNLTRFAQGKLTQMLPPEFLDSVTSRILVRDKDGNVWIGTAGQGLLRVGGRGMDSFRRVQGLSGDTVQAIFEDREGNMWLATRGGLDRLQNPRLARLSTLEGLSGDLVSAVVGSAKGGVWVGTVGNGLNFVEGEKITHYGLREGVAGVTVVSLHEDAAGRLWVGTTGGLSCRAGQRFQGIVPPSPDAFKRVFAISSSRNGDVWVLDGSSGISRIRNMRAERLDPQPSTPGRTVYQLFVDSHDRIWLGYYQGGITIMESDGAKHADPKDGIAGGAVQALFEDRNRSVWVGAAGGLSRFRKGRWTTWTAEHGVPPGGIQGVIQANDGDLWIATRAGLFRLAASGLEGTPDGSPGPLPIPHSIEDNLAPTSAARMANPRLARSVDGRLWVSSDDGVATLHPDKSGRNPLPPIVAIENVRVDGKALEVQSNPCDIRGQEIEFEFTALSFTAPERLRFRYWLQGLEKGWSEPGNRRSIRYVNLPPGDYRFSVIASNGDGVWTASPVSFGFHIPPVFYQTWWFQILCVAAIGLLGLSAHWLRLRSLRTRVALVMAERSRLSRELHDTLLQGFTGVVYQLSAVCRNIEADPAGAREKIERALEQADQSMKEARHAIACMRVPELEAGTLADALSSIGASITSDAGVSLHVHVHGTARELPYESQAAAFLIAREAINNTVSHASASRIDLSLHYMADSLKLSVADNGSGFDMERAAAKSNRWGLKGMRERAAGVGGKLNVTTGPGEGTTVELTIGYGRLRQSELARANAASSRDRSRG
ncbi:MAG: hypothetical protein JNL98_04970 [Bryobacterales bacterium]|nr:hypothetical protein [Bryobacterales bacterium]